MVVYNILGTCWVRSYIVVRRPIWLVLFEIGKSCWRVDTMRGQLQSNYGSWNSESKYSYSRTMIKIIWHIQGLKFLPDCSLSCCLCIYKWSLMYLIMRLYASLVWLWKKNGNSQPYYGYLFSCLCRWWHLMRRLDLPSPQLFTCGWKNNKQQEK